MIRRDGGQAINVSRVAVGPAVDDACPQGDTMGRRTHSGEATASRIVRDSDSWLCLAIEKSKDRTSPGSDVVKFLCLNT